MKKLTLLIAIISCLFINTNAQNNCLDFDGTDDYVNIGDVLDMGTGDFTIETWVKADEFVQDGLGQKVINKGLTSSGNPQNAGYGFRFIKESGINKVRFMVDGGSSSYYYAEATGLQANYWYHIAGVRDENNIKLYIDGSLAHTVNTGSTLNLNTDIYLVIGVLSRQPNSSVFAEFFNGVIDEVRIWNDVRTEAEIRTNMYKELAGTETGLVAYYKLNETSGTNADDSQSSSNNDGTWNGSGGGSNTSPAWQTSPAFFGPKNCLLFNDVSSEYVNCGTSLSGAISGTSFSIEAWIYPTNFKTNTYDNTIAGNSSNANGFLFRYGSSGILEFLIGSSSNWYSVSSSNNALVLNTWQHVSATYNGSNMKLYVNGIESASSAQTRSITASANYFVIGESTDFSTRYMTGKIDEVRVWTSTRSETDIRENMNKTLTGNETNLLAYYNFDNYSGTSLQNFGSNGTTDYDGTLTNMDPATDWVSSTAYNTWLNTNSTSWSTTSNWSRGSVPVLTDNVGISNHTTAGGSDPIIGSALACNHLVIEDTLTFNYTGSHTIHGSAFVIGHSDIRNGNFLTVTKNLYILLLSTLNIDPGGELTIGHKLDNWGTCTIKSDASGTGSLIVNSTSSSIKCERYLASGKWHYISEPVNTSGNFNTLNLGLVAGAGNDQFYRWEEKLEWNSNIGIWVDILNGPDGGSTMDSEGFVKGKGYGIYYKTTNKTLSLSGVPYTSNETINITRTTGSTAEGWNQIGNPFCSTLAGNSSAETTNNFITANIGQLDGSFASFYLWNEQASYQGNRDDYVNFSNSEAAKYIDIGQAFMVKSKAGGGTISFNSNIRKHGTSTFYKNTMQDEVSRFYMSIENNEGLYNE
ncbi:MAG: LamG domain-containing protein, partial [Bacteroidales bacterium]|nr:LamG domain-containing protein [Bacteroidales bacterium]